jgi:hypothetical protein
MESELESTPALSRRRFVQTAAIAAAGVSGSLGAPARGLAASDGYHHRSAAVPPDPIPGGTEIPGGPEIHVWAPGDPSVTLPFSGVTLMGFDVDPSTMTDFRGFSAVGFHVGTAVGSDGATYNVETDLRAYKGTFVASDGQRRFGSFAFI